jgi:hypothetical protein
MRLALSLSTGNHCQVTLKREEGIDRPRHQTGPCVTQALRLGITSQSLLKG